MFLAKSNDRSMSLDGNYSKNIAQLTKVRDCYFQQCSMEMG